LQRAYALSNLADAYIVLGDHGHARELVQAYASLAREGGSHRLLAYANLDAVRMWRAEGRLDDAVALLASESHRALLEQNPDIGLTTETALYEMHKQRCDFEVALHHHELASRMHVLQLTRRAEQQARVMMMRLEVEQTRAAAEFNARRAQSLELERDQLHRVAHEDVLTGMGNRRAADEALAQALQDSPSPGPVSVALVDLDHFKSVNDRYGHAAGDAVLSTVGALMRQALRSQDRVYRYGGEEFLLILGSAAAVVAGEVCERLRLAIECHRWSDISSGLTVTASFGLALHRAGELGPALVQRADAALYRAKREGRNRVALG
jgi:diguanylate cyclase (GGDEF)-like protein